MTYVKKINSFFQDTVYYTLAGFAISPVSWAFKTKITLDNVFDIPDFSKLPDFRKLILVVCLTPVIVPALIVTQAIALCLALISPFVHGLLLAVAGIADGPPPPPQKKCRF